MMQDGMASSQDDALDPLAAAHRLGITAELLFQYTKASFGEVTGLRSLRTMQHAGKTEFAISELDDFDALLAGPWPESGRGRPGIPKAVLDHLRAESMNQCARCLNGVGVDTAHIRPWAVSRSHHHANLIRICSSCHREHDAHNSLTTQELLLLKDALITRTRASLAVRMQPGDPNVGVPRSSRQLFGRESELADLVDALRSGRSVMIAGAGGVGKTELLLHGIRHAATGRRAIWIDVEAYRASADIFAALRAALGGGDTAFSEEEVPARLDALEACVVFDGVEQATLGDFDAFQDAVSDLHSATSIAQFVVTSQVVLHGFRADFRLRLGSLDSVASRQLLDDLRAVPDGGGDVTPLLEFCDGHALTLRLAAALTEHYGGAGPALEAIVSKGVSVVSLPGRTRQNSNTSLEICLRTAFDALSEGGRRLLYALSESPAGLITQFLEGDCLELGAAIETLADLRRWHLTELAQIGEDLTRTVVLSPIRAFAIQAGRDFDRESYEIAVGKLAHASQMTVAVLELNYDDPNSTPYVIARYEHELPNFLRLLELARAQRSNKGLGLIAVSIVRAMMRYFFVRGLSEQGARVMRDAAELAVEIGHAERASGLIIQLISLADRAGDPAHTAAGLALAVQLEAQCDDVGVRGDIALGRAMVARREGDLAAAESFARDAFEGYRGRLREAITHQAGKTGDDENPYEIDEIHNDISHALGQLGFALLSQHRYEEAGKAYRHSLQHERGASVAVNRGQTLHQIGNCESHLGNFREAATLYSEAAKIFEFVGMETYLSNAVGELGYALIDIDGSYPLDDIEESTVRAAMSDLTREIGRTFDLGRPIDHNLAVGVIRKTFGSFASASLTGHAGLLFAYSSEIWAEKLQSLFEAVAQGTRPKDEIFPLAMMELAFCLAFYSAQGEQAFAAGREIPREVINEMLKRVCASGDWERNVMRVVDWLSALLTHRWNLKGAESERLRRFIRNYDNDIEDWLDLGS
ncbi:tetratricopeptide repeat protein [Sphingobium yanoikuyae]|uniref:tetratricopeptide repeat protein n=1 Tax=Sphingobium yanoikuyae TaxID=13690 RepID=UPI00241DBF9D|nr:tetratricopeptide repeat protein [Sphingobium yanoikuyae]